MCKRIIAFLISIVLLLSLLPLTVFAASGTCGENLTWSFSNYVLTISGTGPMTDFSQQYSNTKAPWKDYAVRSVVIEDGVTSIGNQAFYMMDFSSITIGESVTSIGDSAFFYCHNLTSVSIPDSVTSIASAAFSQCTILSSVSIGKSVTSIGTQAFAYCGMTTVTIPNSVTSIGEMAFYFCNNLTSVTIADSVISIGDKAFFYCDSLTGIYVDSANPTYSSDDRGVLFDKEKTTLIQAPGAISGSYSIPESVTSIDLPAFADCNNLTSVTIGDNVASLAPAAFADCINLIGIYVNSANPVYSSDDRGVLFDKEKITLIRAPGAISDSYSIPASVNTVGDSSFAYCNSLTSVTMEESVTTIENGAFAYSDSLTSVMIGENVTTIDTDAFYHCDGLNEITFCGNAPLIGSNAFYRASATAYYPADDPTWTSDVMQNYDGVITWVAYNKDDSSDEEIFPEIKDGVFYYCSDIMSEVFDQKTPMEMKYTYHYDDSWFTESSNVYNHELAQMSIRAALAGFNTDTIANNNAYYIKALMDQLGFFYDEDSIKYPDPNNWTIGYAIGSKNISDDTTVIMVTVRGGGYKDEWYSNCIVGESGDHLGFDEASIQVGDGIYAYINAHAGELKDNVKVWIVGYSRAAAVANLAAADLCNGFIEGISSDDVFAYCFACPQGTVDTNAASSKYSSIKCIVNPIDLVPKVAMSSWDFTRYGITYNLPFAEGSSDYSTYKAEMLAQYDAILSYNGLEDFEARSEAVLALTAESSGQSVAYADVARELASLIGSRYNYVHNLIQSDVASIADLVLGGGLSSDVEILEAIVPGALSLITAGTNLDDIALQFVTVGQLYPDTIEQFGKMSTFATAHYPELYLAWIDSLEGEYKNYNGKYIKVFINCPVDVMVLDETNNVVGQIINNEAIDIENGVNTYIDRDSQKVIILPCDADYEIQLTATDNGTVTYTVEEWDMGSQNSSYMLSYYDIEIATGDVLLGLIPESTEDEATEYTLLGTSAEANAPSKEYTGGEVTTYFIDVVADGHGTAYASPCKLEGEYVIVCAVANDNESFMGWYDGENLVSTEENYRFRVESDVALTAKFTRLNHSSETGTVIKDSTCTDTGIETHICDLCGDEYTVELPATGHSYNSVVTDPTCTEQGYTTHTCSNCGDSYTDSSTEVRGHDYVSVVTEPTETERGYTTHTCTRCDDSYVDSYTAPLGHEHSWEEGVVTKKATCTESGEKTYTCETCGETMTEEIPVTDHAYEDGVCTACGAEDLNNQPPVEDPTEEPTKTLCENTDDDLPDTGDAMHVILWMSMLMVSFVGVTALILNREKWQNI